MIVLSAVCLGACASSMGAVRSAVDEAPEWFKERRVEIRGENYPDIRTVPQITGGDIPTLDTESERLVDPARARSFLDHPRAAPPDTTPDEIRAWIRSRQQILAAVSAPTLSDLSPPDTSVFDAPRGQLPPGAR